MISSITSQNLQKLIISTGNILSNKLKPLAPREELQDGLKLTLCESCKDEGNDIEFDKAGGKVLRATKELHQKITENDRTEISIGAKIFLNKSENGETNIDSAVASLLHILNVEHVDNIVLAYHPDPRENCNSTPSTPVVGGANDGFKWNSRNEQRVQELIRLWTTLEQFALDKKIQQLGVSDLDVETLTQLYDVARVKPTIAQINLSSCCVVPPPLQEFCANHDIQLLTHSDPEALLPVNEEFILPGFVSDWSLRYQVYVRCRGVINSKGYLVGARKPESD